MAALVLAAPPWSQLRQAGCWAARRCGSARPRTLCSQGQPHAAHRDEDEAFMAEALLEAEKAASAGEVPVGAVIVHEGVILARAHNRVEARGDPTAHAELLAIQQAAPALARWAAPGAALYVTLEPCPQCVGALLLARLGRLVTGAASPRGGAAGSWVDLLPQPHPEHGGAEQGEGRAAVARPATPYPLSPPVQVRRGVLAEESQQLMRDFFKRRREENRSKAAAQLKALGIISERDL